MRLYGKGKEEGGEGIEVHEGGLGGTERPSQFWKRLSQNGEIIKIMWDLLEGRSVPPSFGNDYHKMAKSFKIMWDLLVRFNLLLLVTLRFKPRPLVSLEHRTTLEIAYPFYKLQTYLGKSDELTHDIPCPSLPGRPANPSSILLPL